MNVLLYAPGWLVILLLTHGVYSTISILFVYCALPQVSQLTYFEIIDSDFQVLLAVPFLFTNPIGYLSKAFEFQRKFLYQWTVNWRFLPEHVFLSGSFHALLLMGHLACLLVFIYKRWTRCGFQNMLCIYVYALFFRQHGGIIQLLNTSSPQIALSNNGKITSVIH